MIGHLFSGLKSGHYDSALNWLARERNISNELEEKLRKLEDPNFENIVEILKNDLPGFVPS